MTIINVRCIRASPKRRTPFRRRQGYDTKKQGVSWPFAGITPCLASYNGLNERAPHPSKGYLAMIDMTAPFRLDPKARDGNYARQRQMTLSDLLMENRIIFWALARNRQRSRNQRLRGHHHHPNARLYLQYENKSQEIHMYINKPGGSRCHATLAIYDTVQFLECPVVTYCMGLAASGARDPPRRRDEGTNAIRPAELEGDDPSAVGPGRRPNHRHGNPGGRKFLRSPTPQRTSLGETSAERRRPRSRSRPLLSAETLSKNSLLSRPAEAKEFDK